LKYPRPFRIVFMGTPDFALPSLEALLHGPDHVAAVVTQPDRPRGRGRRPGPSPVKEAAERAGLPVYQPVKARAPEFVQAMREVAPDLLVVAAYGQILPQALLDVPGIMPINVHGSLLPKYRGAAPIQWAILEGETETGITIMEMDAGMDTGPMLLRGALPIGPEETFGQLYPRMARLGADLLVKALGELHRGTLVPVPQPGEGVSFAPPIRSEMAEIDWAQPARRIAGLIRALDPRPGAFTRFGEHRIRLYGPRSATDAAGCPGPPGRVCTAGPEGVAVATGQGVLLLRELQWPGGRRLAAADFLRGREIPEGARFGGS